MRDRKAEVNRVLDNIARCLETGRPLAVEIDKLHEEAPKDTRRRVHNLRQKEDQHARQVAGRRKLLLGGSREWTERRAAEDQAHAEQARAAYRLPPAPVLDTTEVATEGLTVRDLAAILPAREPAAPPTRYAALKAAGGPEYERYMARARERARAYHARRRAARLAQ